MLIQCTKALLDKMDIDKNELKSSQGHEHFPDSLKAWHANIINIYRRKAIVLMNNETRYVVVIYRPKPKDFKEIKKLIKEGIIAALHMEGISEDIINRYMVKAGEIEFSKTANASMVAKMNKAVRSVWVMSEYLDESTLIQRYISIMTSRFTYISLNDEGFYPIEKMIEDLGIYCSNDNNGDTQEVLDFELYQLKIKIDIEGFDIWRKVLVPSTYSFRHLHNIIQTVFDWQNYHLHAFEVKKDDMIVIRVVMDNNPDTLEWLDFYDYDVLQESFVALEDIFPEYSEVSYEYDFGDSWNHTITCEKSIKSHEFKVSYLGGEGERPPEDVGGSGGYEEYMSIMADETDPEYESMKIWAESQKEREISPEKINERLKRVINGYYYSPYY